MERCRVIKALKMTGPTSRDIEKARCSLVCTSLFLLNGFVSILFISFGPIGYGHLSSPSINAFISLLIRSYSKS